MLRFLSFVMHSVRWSQLRRIKSCNGSWSMSQSTLSRIERSTCSSVSSSLNWQIILNNGMTTAETSGTSLAASSTIKETLRRCSRYLKVMIDITLCCQSQSTCHGRHMDGSDHRDSKTSLQALRIRSFMRFTRSIGSVMQSITCTTSGWLTASCSIATANQVMEGTTSPQGPCVERSKTCQKCQKSQRQGSCALSLIRIQCHTRMKSSTTRSSFTSSSHSMQIWSAEREMFNIYQTASSFMTQHVLYHESIAISNWYISETILEIMQNTQVRLTERVIKIIRGNHPHMESFLISGGEFRQVNHRA